MRHASRLLEQPTRILSRGFANFQKLAVFDPPLCGNMVLVQCPKDEGSFPQFTGLCKPTVKNKKKLRYNPEADFTNADVNSTFKPNIPDLPEIKTPEDIIKAAVFIRKYANYMTVEFLKTQEVLGEYVNEHRLALLSEPANFLHLIRSGEPSHIIDRVANRSKKALEQPRDAENQLILLFCSDELNLAFNRFERKSWAGWLPNNKEHIDAILCFAKAIYKDTPDIEAYKTEEEFNAALMQIDPDFRQLLV